MIRTIDINQNKLRRPAVLRRGLWPAILLPMLFLLGCRANVEEHAHEEIVKIPLTAYSERFELFAETDPLAVGRPCAVLAHFTHLSDFKPLSAGKIRLSLTGTGESVVAEQDRPDRPGVFRFSVTPRTPGPAGMTFDLPGGDRLVLSGLEVHADAEEALHAAEERPAAPPGVVFTKEMSWKVDFATGLPTAGAFSDVIRTTARIQSARGDESVIAAKSGGLLRIADGQLVEGKPLKAGQEVCSIAGGDITENNLAVRYAEARNNHDRARAEYERVGALAGDRIVSEKELLQARTEFENARAVYENLSRNFDGDAQAVTSPIDGFLKQVFVQNGQHVSAGQPIAVVSRNRKLTLRADIRPADAAKLNEVVTATLRMLPEDRAVTLEQLNGRVLSVGKSVNEDNFMIPVTLQVDNRGSLLPGAFVELFLKTAPRPDSLSVPNTALLEEQGITYVFKQVTPELFAKQEVKTGGSDGLQTEILSGLSRGERIVVRGAVWVKLAQASGALDPHSGHTH